MEFLAQATTAAADAAGTYQQVGFGAIAYALIIALREFAIRKWPDNKNGLTADQKSALYETSRSVDALVKIHSTIADDGGPDWKLSNGFRRDLRENQNAIASATSEVAIAIKAMAKRETCAEKLCPMLQTLTDAVDDIAAPDGTPRRRRR